MNTDFLETQLVAYLSLRQALGFQMRAEQVLLPEFVAFLQAHHLTGPIRAHLALEWATQTSARRGVSGASKRLTIARRFLTYLQASAPETEVPASGLLPAPRRSKPYLFTPMQRTTLFEAARASRPRNSLRPHTLSTLIGLLTSTGLRAGEAIRFQVGDVKLDLAPPADAYPGDETPQIPDCAAPSEHGGAAAPLPSLARTPPLRCLIRCVLRV